MSTRTRSVYGIELRTGIQGRSDPVMGALPIYLGREVERGVSYNTPADPGANNTTQSVSGAQHSHGTPDGSAGVAFNAWASAPGDDPAIYVPNHVKQWYPMIRGSIRRWEVRCEPHNAVVSFLVTVPGFYDPLTMRQPDPGGTILVTDASNGVGSAIPSINTNWGLSAEIELTLNGDGSGNDNTKAQSVALLLYKHRNKDYDLTIIRQLNPNDPDPSDIPILDPVLGTP